MTSLLIQSNSEDNLRILNVTETEMVFLAFIDSLGQFRDTVSHTVGT